MRGGRGFLRGWRYAVLPVLAWACAGPVWSGPEASGALPASREVALATADKLQISATFWPSPTKGGAGVVLLPMWQQDRASWDPVVDALRDRGVHVLALDLRGHGKSAKQGKTDLAPRVVKRDPKLFAAMQEDVTAALRWLGKEGGCDPKRIALLGAGLGGAVALDTVSRHPTEVAAVAWLSPTTTEPGLETLASLKGVPAATPLLCLAHAKDAEGGARKLSDARPSTRLVVYADEPPAKLAGDPTWAQGTRMLTRLPLVVLTVASFVAAATGSTTDDVVLDGVVTAEGPDADPWDRAGEVMPANSLGTVRAFRVGRRIVFGGTVEPGVKGLRFEVQTGEKTHMTEGIPVLGPPQVVAVDLTKGGQTAWSWGGMGSLPNFPGLDPKGTFGKTVPWLRAIPSEAGTTFEGEWFIPRFGGKSEAIRICVTPTTEVPAAPENGMVGVDLESSVELDSR